MREAPALRCPEELHVLCHPVPDLTEVHILPPLEKSSPHSAKVGHSINFSYPLSSLVLRHVLTCCPIVVKGSAQGAGVRIRPHIGREFLVCKYLGVITRGGKYEPQPYFFPAGNQRFRQVVNVIEMKNQCPRAIPARLANTPSTYIRLGMKFSGQAFMA